MFHDYLLKSFTLDTLTDLSIEYCQEHGWKAIVLDFDGVLSSFGKPQPDERMIKHAAMLSDHGLLVAIHSNNPHGLEKTRERWLKINYPQILWMSSRPYKPNPSTLIHLSQRWKLESHQIAMVDDRFLTGGKAAYHAQSSFIYIKQPLIDRSFAFWGELWFYAIRSYERYRYQQPPFLCTQEDSNL
jgi:predicted HAD superfamily phosphohydrolase YqeG